MEVFQGSALFFAILSLLIIDSTWSCGILTHITLGQRATEYFEVESGGVNYRELVLKHQDAFQAGSPFPDTFYNSLCRSGTYHSVSEETHWTPFANATVNYIRRKYPQPWTKDTEKLVAFLFGIIGHSVSDTSWHSLGISQGFLRAMGNVNFHGSYEKAHSTGDFGGDVVNAVDLDISDVGFLDSWYIPTTDLVEIYKEFYGYARMDADIINECAIWMYLGRAGESLGVINLLFPYYSGQSPFLVNHMQDYFLGAMDDMVAWTTNGWRNIVHMIDHGTESCELNRNPLYVRCDEKSHKPNLLESVLKKEGPTLSEGANDGEYIRGMVKDLDHSFIQTEKTPRGMYIKASNKLTTLIRDKIKTSKNQFLRLNRVPDVEPKSASKTLEPNVFYDSNTRYSRLGKSLASADMNNDSYIDLIIGAPGHGVMGNQLQGRVYIVHGTADGLPNKNLTLDTDADVILDGIQKDGMFGHDIAVVDLNADGINDLAVSAPSVGSPELTYNGEVYIYYGQKTGELSKDPDLTLKCKQRYCNLGWSLASSDVNNDGFDDLIIGAPFAAGGGEQNGFAAAVFSKTMREQNELYEASFDWIAEGDMKYAWFGYDVAASPANVVVGSPTRRICTWADCSYDAGDVQAAGQVSVFKTPITSTTTVWRVFTGTKENDYMGAHVHLGDFAGRSNVFGFALPAQDVGWLVDKKAQAGVSRMYEITKNSGIVKIAEYRGARSYARFGMTSWFEDVNGDGVDDVLIGSPHWTDGLGFHSGALQGRVFAFDGTKASGNINVADWELVYSEDKSKFGTSISSVKNTNKVDVAVSAPGSNAKSKFAGRVAIFSFTKKSMA